jgi:hypothetical protein
MEEEIYRDELVWSLEIEREGSGEEEERLTK